MITYQDCGVDPQKNDMLVAAIASKTTISTGFADARQVPGTDQFIVQCSDGVGTKIQLGVDYPEIYKTIGQDLVAMCVNDLICAGARPAFFQDYIGMNSLDPVIVDQLIGSINDACERCGVVLTGGEMAEMPGTYQHNVPELVGFATGFGTAKTIRSNNLVRAGDVIIGLASSGPHSNGYTLIRKAIAGKKLPRDVIAQLLEPTQLYCGVSDFYQQEPKAIHALAHITGGGLINNLTRVIPDNLEPKIRYEAWSVPEIFHILCDVGDIDPNSAWETFNMGVGMCLIVPSSFEPVVIDELSQYTPFTIGVIE